MIKYKNAINSLKILWLNIVSFNPQNTAECYVGCSVFFILACCFNFDTYSVNGVLHLKHRKFRFFSLFLLACTSFSYISVIYIRIKGLNDLDVHSYYCIVLFFMFNAIMGCITIMVYNINGARLIDLLNYFDELHMNMAENGITVPYRSTFFLAFKFININLILFFLTFMFGLHPIDFIVIVYPYTVRMFITFCLTLSFHNMTERFVALRNSLKLIDHQHGKYITPQGKSPEQILYDAEKYYDTLIHILHALIHTYEIIVSANIIGNTMEIVFSVIINYMGGIKDFSLIQYFIIFIPGNISYAFLYYKAYMLTMQVKETFISLGLSRMICVHKNLSTNKNSLLLQSMHNKVEIKLLGVIELKLSIFISQINICTTLIVILMQYYKRYIL